MLIYGFYVLGVLLAIPYGILADRYGRKWLMLLNMVAFELAAAWLYLVCTYVSPCLLALKSVHVCLELLYSP